MDKKMPLIGYLETLNRFGLDELKSGGDLQVENGDKAITADGDLKMGNDRFNALFRLVERWRVNEPTLNDLFESTMSTASRLAEVMEARNLGVGPLLSLDPQAFHEASEAIGEGEHGSSVFAGAILVVLNNLLRR